MLQRARARGGRALRAAAGADGARRRAHPRRGHASGSQGARGEQPPLPQRRAGARRLPARRRAGQAHRGCAPARTTSAAPTEGWRQRRAEAGGGAFLDHGLPLLDLALWLADFPEPVRVVAPHGARPRARTRSRMRCSCSSSSRTARCSASTWSATTSARRSAGGSRCSRTRGSTRLAPLRVVKELHGRPADVSPRGAAARESAFIQSYRAELAHFVAVISGDAEYEAPTDQVMLHRVSRRSTSRRTRGRRSACDAVPRAARACVAARCSRCAPRSASAARRRRAAARARPCADPPAGADGLAVFLVTFGQGAAGVERFGHNASGCTTQPPAPTSRTTGGSSTSQPDFLRRFLTGDTRYWMEANDADAMVEFYRQLGRTITLQRLNLTPAAEAAACATSSLERAGGEQVLPLRLLPRQLLHAAARRARPRARRRAARGDGFDPHAAQLSGARACGSPTATARSQRGSTSRSAARPTCRSRRGSRSSSRCACATRVRDVHGADGAGGARVPLVASERTIEPYPGTPRVAERQTAPRLVVAAAARRRRARRARRGDPRDGGEPARRGVGPRARDVRRGRSLCGLIGVILVLAWTATRHIFWAANENLFLFTPLSLRSWCCCRWRCCAARRRVARAVAIAVAGCGLLALMPGGQENRAVVVMFLPVHLAIAWLVLDRRCGATCRSIRPVRSSRGSACQPCILDRDGAPLVPVDRPGPQVQVPSGALGAIARRSAVGDVRRHAEPARALGRQRRSGAPARLEHARADERLEQRGVEHALLRFHARGCRARARAARRACRGGPSPSARRRCRRSSSCAPAPGSRSAVDAARIAACRSASRGARMRCAGRARSSRVHGICSRKRYVCVTCDSISRRSSSSRLPRRIIRKLQLVLLEQRALAPVEVDVACGSRSPRAPRSCPSASTVGSLARSDRRRGSARAPRDASRRTLLEPREP